MTRSVLVTGASGFIGRRLVKALAADGWRVRAAARTLGAGDLGDHIESVILSDLRESVDWRALLQDIDAVVHLAGIAHAGGPLSDALYDQVNHQAAAELAVACRQAGIRHFILMSSIRAQVGPWSPRILTEEDTPEPTDAYGRSKLLAERATKDSGVDFTILRPVVVYGPEAKGNLAFVERLAATPLPLPLKGFQAPRSLIGIESLVSAVKFVLETRSSLGQTYIVADHPPQSLADIISQCRRERRARPGLFYVPPGVAAAILKIMGREDIWDRIGKPLLVDPSKLAAAGWKAKDVRS